MQNAPSGIAQLRKSTQQAALHSNPDAMNIDDFIFSEDAATPAGISLSPQPASKLDDDFQRPAAAHAIPIKSRKDQAQHQHQHQQQQHQFVPQSVPEPPHHQNTEFNYVKRHPRKTSIDERRVSFESFSAVACAVTLLPLWMPPPGCTATRCTAEPCTPCTKMPIHLHLFGCSLPPVVPPTPTPRFCFIVHHHHHLQFRSPL